MNEKRKFNIPTPVFFLIAAFIIILFCPREGKFKYSYVEGKPWKHGLLTASFDFPIYKAQSQIEKERDSLLANYQPYYKIDMATPDKTISEFEANAKANDIPEEYIRYIRVKFRQLYQSGIISAEDYDKIEKTKPKQIRLIENNNIAVGRYVFTFYTSKSAYEKLIEDKPDNLDIQVMNDMNLNEYIFSNILYDNETSTKARDELLSQISPAQGMVQSGEKIIDRGELVTSNTYMILESLKKATEEASGSRMQKGWLLVGESILVVVFMFSFFLYLYFFRPREYSNQKNVVFMLMNIAGFCVLTGLALDYNLFNIYIIPYVISTIMIRTFIDSRTAFTTHIVMIIICSFMVPFPSEFLTLQLAAGFACIFSLKDLSERSQLIRCSFFILVTYIVVYVGYILTVEAGITQSRNFESIKEYWLMMLYFGINFIFVMFAYLLVYICEKVFGFISGVSMVELSNTNKPLLQKLSEVAPGTFQHSIQVSNLAAAVALKLGANAALVRTGALYHDIGKMPNPIFFTENQAPDINPHKNLSYVESAKVIVNHVEEGVRIAKKYKLPQQIVDFIVSHHGLGKAKYFYNSYKNEHPGEEFDEKPFSYPGPNPYSKEMAILMMADSVEAASHSISIYTEESISRLVEKVIDGQMQDGLLRNAPLTFQDIENAKAVFKEKLLTIYHTRIQYPELNKTENPQ